jgi:hypothetical protein
MTSATQTERQARHARSNEGLTPSCFMAMLPAYPSLIGRERASIEHRGWAFLDAAAIDAGSTTG